jgi:hypothetical protein
LRRLQPTDQFRDPFQDIIPFTGVVLRQPEGLHLGWRFLPDLLREIGRVVLGCPESGFVLDLHFLTIWCRLVVKFRFAIRVSESFSLMKIQDCNFMIYLVHTYIFYRDRYFLSFDSKCSLLGRV